MRAALSIIATSFHFLHEEWAQEKFYVVVEKSIIEKLQLARISTMYISSPMWIIRTPVKPELPTECHCHGQNVVSLLWTWNRTVQSKREFYVTIFFT